MCESAFNASLPATGYVVHHPEQGLLNVQKCASWTCCTKHRKQLWMHSNTGNAFSDDVMTYLCPAVRQQAPLVTLKIIVCYTPYFLQ